MPERVGLYPARVSNPYQSRMGKALAERYTVVKVPKIKWLALGRLKRVGPKLDVLLVCWLENTLVSRRSGRLRRAGLLQFRLKLWVLGRLAQKLVMVRHNQFPHRTHPEDRARVKALIDQLEARFDAVITHSGHNAEGRFYVPHPLYETVESVPVEQPAAPYCLAFGHVLPYKNLLALVECWNGPCRLLIAGPGSNKAYLDALKKVSEGKPVDIRAGFLPENDAIALVQGAACTVLAHAGEDMIVSGSYFFSISQGTPVYGIQTPFLSWLAASGGPGVRCFDAIEGLAWEAGGLQGASTGEEQQEIRQAAQVMFGDEAVRAHVGQLLRAIGV